MILPTHVDVLLPRRPYANYFLMAAITLTSTLQILGYLPHEFLMEYFVAKDLKKPSGLFLSVFLHMDFFHLIGNMAFQWVFGNAVCSKIGNWKFLILYFLFEFASSICHIQFSDNGAIGASGAINGIIGLYFAMYPRNYIYVFYFFWFSFWGHTRVPGYLLIVSWFIMDAWGALEGGGMTAYWAHLGGFAGGMLAAVIMLKNHWIEFHRVDQPHLFEKFFGRFNVDSFTAKMIEACALMDNKEFTVRIGDMDDVRYPANILYRMMESGKARGDDEIYDEKTAKWISFAHFFNTLSASPEIISKRNKAVVENTLPEKEYFIHKDGENFGPFKILDLKNHLHNGQIEEDALVFEAETNNWMKVKDIV
ncbi:MAG: rhomboid family intramembrane serine protease [Lentisphaeraceae bacterium]|nr:rhomboid family intramembrane serine protease [Lentisphaeraceae bacterium]